MEAILEAQTRTSFGKNEARRTRAAGQVPAVLYGGDAKGATPIAVAPKALLRILHSLIDADTQRGPRVLGVDDVALRRKQRRYGSHVDQR